MKVIAILLGLISVALFAISAWLLRATILFYLSDAYRPNAVSMTRYTVGNIEANGNGIFAPGALLLLLAVFFAKFAWNIWRGTQSSQKAQVARKYQNSKDILPR